MPALAHHLVLRLEESRLLAPTPPARRWLAGSLVRCGGPDGLLAFGIADTHAHVLLTADRAKAGAMARRAEAAAQRHLRPGVPFEPARYWAVKGQFHLENTFIYVLRQAEHHGVTTDPFHDGSLLPELLGLRVGGREVVEHVQQVLPRCNRADLLALLGLESLEPGLPCEHLADAAAAAFGLPDLSGRDARTLAARAAAVAFARRTLEPGEVARLLGTSPKTVTRHEGRRPTEAEIEAVALQAGLRQRRSSGGGGGAGTARGGLP